MFFWLSENANFKSGFLEFCVHIFISPGGQNVFCTQESKKPEKTGTFLGPKMTILSTQNDLHFFVFFQLPMIIGNYPKVKCVSEKDRKKA